MLASACDTGDLCRHEPRGAVRPRPMHLVQQLHLHHGRAHAAGVAPGVGLGEVEVPARVDGDVVEGPHVVWI